MGTVRVRDEALGAPAFEFEILLDAAELTVAELIAGRVTAELARIAEVPVSVRSSINPPMSGC